jgi:hypothetical protein
MELVGCTQVALQTGRLKIASELPEVSILTTELQNFQVQISQSGFDSYNARSGQHDDLVLALAMALWLAQEPVRRILYAWREINRWDNDVGGKRFWLRWKMDSASLPQQKQLVSANRLYSKGAAA